MNLKNKHVIVLGAGSSGRDAAALALREGADVAVHDSRDAITGMPDGVTAVPGANVQSGKDSCCDLLVVSPGIDGTTNLVQAYAANAGEMIGEIELAYRYYHGRIIAITGTNGKTTTTELVERILTHSGKSCYACGNYGPTFSSMVLMDEPPESIALEVSSFQLETIREFHPEVVIWLNFSPDHMDRYPTVEAYKAAKMRVFENMESDNSIVARAGEDIGSQQAVIKTFSTEGDADYTLIDKSIAFHGEKLIDLSHTRLRGLHNAENAMAAFAACTFMGITAPTAEDALRGFAPPMHRCELIRTLDGVEYINDSKATNLHALDSALRSQGRPVILIAGGKQKGLDYSEILPRLEATTKCIVVFGEIADQLAETFQPVCGICPCTIADSLEDAVHIATEFSDRGNTILFSPGTSSFDMFSGYEERGDCFRRIVNQLK